MELLPVEIPEDVLANPPLVDRARDEGCYLYLATSSARLDYSSTDAFFDSLYKNPLDNGKGVGHSWIVLRGPGGKRAMGHSGEYGKLQPTYADGIRGLMDEGDPNPARYLWVEMVDGHLLRGPGASKPTWCGRVPITLEQHDRILAWAESFDYRHFALRGKGCSDYVVTAARMADLYLPNRMRLVLPRRIRMWGGVETLWTDPRWSTVVFGTPEILEQGLRELAGRGVVQKADYPF